MPLEACVVVVTLVLENGRRNWGGYVRNDDLCILCVAKTRQAVIRDLRRVLKSHLAYLRGENSNIPASARVMVLEEQSAERVTPRWRRLPPIKRQYKRHWRRGWRETRGEASQDE